MQVMQRFYIQLPAYARPSHPVMQYILQRQRRGTNRRLQILRIVAAMVVLALMIVAGLQVATEFGRVPLDTLDTGNPLDRVFLVLFWPIVALQLLMRIFALGATVGVVSAEVQRGTWDTLKVTTEGANLLMRTRWAAVFYRLSLLLIVLVLVRLFFIFVALIHLASYQGRYLDLLLSGTTPLGAQNVPETVSVVAGILIVAMMMTASLLAPFTAIAFDASLGMLIGTLARGRLIGALGQVIVVAGRIVLTGVALWIGALSLSLGPLSTLTPITGQLEGWLAAFVGVAEGDLGLTLLHLPNVPRIWADRDYGVFVGLAFLGYVLVQALLANLLVYWAARRAARADQL